MEWNWIYMFRPSGSRLSSTVLHGTIQRKHTARKKSNMISAEKIRLHSFGSKNIPAMSGGTLQIVHIRYRRERIIRNYSQSFRQFWIQ